MLPSDSGQLPLLKLSIDHKFLLIRGIGMKTYPLLDNNNGRIVICSVKRSSADLNQIKITIQFLCGSLFYKSDGILSRV